jgi:membrane-associated phospholipid phosphatase
METHVQNPLAPEPGREKRLLRAHDWVILSYLAVEAALLVLFGRTREPHWPWYLCAHAAMAAGIFLLARAACTFRSRLLTIGRDWYPAVYVLLVFKQLGVLVPAVNPATFDEALLAWDRALFGGHPGAFFDALASPVFTEILRACWLSYFILPFVVVVPIYVRRERAAFNEAVLVLMLGWLISYLGYYAVPALGPGYFPEAVPAPESVSAEGMTQSVALTLFSLEGRMHDIFPSGHTIIALLALWLAARNRLRGWPLLVPVVAGLMVGTVYLRYHYGVDVAAGVIIAAAIVLCRIGFRKGKTAPA